LADSTGIQVAGDHAAPAGDGRSQDISSYLGEDLVSDQYDSGPALVQGAKSLIRSTERRLPGRVLAGARPYGLPGTGILTHRRPAPRLRQAARLVWKVA
jgi:hypothetical protein